MLIGLSYSRCVLDIVQNRVNTDAVLVIVAGTLMDPEKPDEWRSIWNGYSRSTWQNVADEKTFYDVTMKLWKSGRIHQPRKFGSYVVNTHIHWVEACLPIEELKRNPTTKAAFEKLQVLAGLADIKIGPEYL